MTPLGVRDIRACVQRWLPRALLLLVCLVATTGPAAAQLSVFETPGLRLVYLDPSGRFIVPYAARTFLASLDFQKRVLGFDPAEDTVVLVVDLQDTGNAGASAVPHNLLMVQLAPLSHAFETVHANERMFMIMNHELVHVTMMDQPSRRDRLFRTLFAGKVRPVAEHPETALWSWLTAPRNFSPRWYLEGAAVFFDTWMAAGLGRAQGGYDEMVFRAKVRDGATIYDRLGLVSEGTKIDFQDEANSYLYGTRFMTWVARRHSPEKLVQWVSRPEGSRASYARDFHRVFGETLDQAWATWQRDEKTFQQANLDAIGRYPLTPFEDLVPRALGAVSRAYLDERTRTLYAGVSYPGTVSHIAALSLDSGRVERLVDIKGPSMFTVASLARDPESGTLFYTADNGQQRDLMRLDPATRRTELLIKDARIGDLAFNRADRSIWGIRHLNGICTIVRLPAPYRQWEQVVSWPYGTVVYDLDVSPDGTRIVASFGEISGTQDVRVFDAATLRARGTAPVARFDFGQSVPNHFVFSPDGRYVYGSAYYTGVSNIFRYDLEAKKVEAVTNTDTGFFRPLPLDDGTMIAFRYSGEGFVPTRVRIAPIEDIAPITFLGERLAEEHPIVREWAVGSPQKIPLETLPQSTSPYSPLRRMRLDALHPIVQSYKGTGAPGVRLAFSDPLQFSRGSVVATYSAITGLPEAERIHVQAEVERGDWRGGFTLNGADFYDFFGPTKASRKGYVLEGGWKHLLVYDSPKRLELDLSGTYSGNLDRLPDYQNVAVDVDRLGTLQAKLSWSDVRNSLGHVDDEKGSKWSVAAQGQQVAGRFVTRVAGTYDHHVAAFGNHSTLWLRNAAGLSPDDRDDPFANFYFGAFGNNWVDHLEEKRYRTLHSFPGAALNGIGGRNFLKSALEWNLPPWRFRRLGWPGFHATWARPAVFVGGLGTDLDHDATRTVATNVGGQVDVRLGVAATQQLTLSFGGAVAFERGRGPRREAMISLKILR
ncbi:hypothetical protein TBR22_A10240 [Luteitalea sp. TBR-22]|uniref:LpqB family beta-propeller domain-containing protein n=1 Tax=Luteitalea sp. TBR-22 TaxID=2802971 RepID=UPI001AF1A826|nr:LpqB family beta-propeller domain-containing protein [Luteitalea sp. TBR-22]BCS31820.1 hypothetical protein TBR22_A10240 [Luteitalea sp. TBR-22]